MKEVCWALPGPLAPRIHVVLARLARKGRGLLAGGPAGQRVCVLVCAVAAVTLWVTASAHGSKRSVHLTRLGSGFYFAPGRTAPDSWQLARSRHRPEELVICACKGACAPRGEEGTSCPLPFPGHPGLSQSPCGGFFMPPWSRLFYQGTIHILPDGRKKRSKKQRKLFTINTLVDNV
jgi:hypothetical protein